MLGENTHAQIGIQATPFFLPQNLVHTGRTIVASPERLYGFHGAWLQFWKARVGVSTQRSCVQNLGKEVIH